MKKNRIDLNEVIISGRDSTAKRVALLPRSSAVDMANRLKRLLLAAGVGGTITVSSVDHGQRDYILRAPSRAQAAHVN